MTFTKEYLTSLYKYHIQTPFGWEYTNDTTRVDSVMSVESRLRFEWVNIFTPNGVLTWGQGDTCFEKLA